jgi:mono/diheme cytochrome c family protein
MTYGIRAAAVILLGAIFVAGPTYSQAPGADTYKAKCLSCHGVDGQAATPLGKSWKILPMKDSAMVHASDARLIASTTNGKGKMPAYKGKLTDAQIKDVVLYMRTLEK